MRTHLVATCPLYPRALRDQDPPSIRSPSKEHAKFLREVESTSDGRAYLGRRTALDFCNFLLLSSGVTTAKFNASKLLADFSAYAAGGRPSRHPLGDGIPKFSRHQGGCRRWRLAAASRANFPISVFRAAHALAP